MLAIFASIHDHATFVLMRPGRSAWTGTNIAKLSTRANSH